jgi:hypothetical protein
MGRIVVETVYEPADEAFIAWWIKCMEESGVPIDVEDLERGEQVVLMNKDPTSNTWGKTTYQVFRSTQQKENKDG